MYIHKLAKQAIDKFDGMCFELETRIIRVKLHVIASSSFRLEIAPTILDSEQMWKRRGRIH